MSKSRGQLPSTDVRSPKKQTVADSTAGGSGAGPGMYIEISGSIEEIEKLKAALKTAEGLFTAEGKFKGSVLSLQTKLRRGQKETGIGLYELSELGKEAFNASILKPDFWPQFFEAVKTLPTAALPFQAFSASLPSSLILDAKVIKQLEKHWASIKIEDIEALLCNPKVFFIDKEALLINTLQGGGFAELLCATISHAVARNQSLDDMGVTPDSIKSILMKGANRSCSQLFFSLIMIYFIAQDKIAQDKEAIFVPLLEKMKEMLPEGSSQVKIIEDFKKLLHDPEIRSTQIYFFCHYFLLIKEIEVNKEGAASSAGEGAEAASSFEDGFASPCFTGDDKERVLIEERTKQSQKVRRLIPDTMNALICEHRLMKAMKSGDVIEVIKDMANRGIKPGLLSKFDGLQFFNFIYHKYYTSKDEALKEKFRKQIEEIIQSEESLDDLVRSLSGFPAQDLDTLKQDKFLIPIINNRIQVLLSSYRSVMNPKEIEASVQKPLRGIRLTFHDSGRELSLMTQSALRDVLIKLEQAELLRFAMQHCYINLYEGVKISRDGLLENLEAVTPYEGIAEKWHAIKESISSLHDDKSRLTDLVRVILEMGATPISIINDTDKTSLNLIASFQDLDLLDLAFTVAQQQSSELNNSARVEYIKREYENFRSLWRSAKGTIKVVHCGEGATYIEKLESYKESLKNVELTDLMLKHVTSMTRVAELVNRKTKLVIDIVAALGFSKRILHQMIYSISEYSETMAQRALEIALGPLVELRYSFFKRDKDGLEDEVENIAIAPSDLTQDAKLQKAMRDHFGKGLPSTCIKKQLIAKANPAEWQSLLNDWLQVMIQKNYIDCARLLIRRGARLSEVDIKTLSAIIVCGGSMSLARMQELFLSSMNLCTSVEEMRCLRTKFAQILDAAIKSTSPSIEVGMVVAVLDKDAKERALKALDNRIEEFASFCTVEKIQSTKKEKKYNKRKGDRDATTQDSRSATARNEIAAGSGAPAALRVAESSEKKGHDRVETTTSDSVPVASATKSVIHSEPADDPEGFIKVQNRRQKNLVSLVSQTVSNKAKNSSTSSLASTAANTPRGSASAGAASGQRVWSGVVKGETSSTKSKIQSPATMPVPVAPMPVSVLSEPTDQAEKPSTTTLDATAVNTYSSEFEVQRASMSSALNTAMDTVTFTNSEIPSSASTSALVSAPSVPVVVGVEMISTVSLVDEAQPTLSSPEAPDPLAFSRGAWVPSKDGKDLVQITAPHDSSGSAASYDAVYQAYPQPVYYAAVPAYTAYPQPVYYGAVPVYPIASYPVYYGAVPAYTASPYTMGYDTPPSYSGAPHSNRTESPYVRNGGAESSSAEGFAGQERKRQVARSDKAGKSGSTPQEKSEGFASRYKQDLSRSGDRPFS